MCILLLIFGLERGYVAGEVNVPVIGGSGVLEKMNFLRLTQENEMW